MIKIYAYGEVPNSEIFARNHTASDVADTVAAIIARVAAEGDAALLDYTRRFDRAELSSLAVSAGELEEAIAAVEPKFLEILREAAANIRAFHEKQVRQSFVVTGQGGIVTGQKITTIERVGLYVPGGTAA